MNHLSLQADLGIERVAELQAALQPHLDADAPLQLAGDRVERVHAAGLQLLHAFVRDRAARGATTTIIQPSPTLAAAARQLALAASLGVDEGDHGHGAAASGAASPTTADTGATA